MMTDNVIDLCAWKGRTQVSKQGPKKNVTNLMLYLRNVAEIGPKLGFNDLSGNIEWGGLELKDSDYISIRLLLEAADYEPSAKDVPACVLRASEDNIYNPIAEYLGSLVWDKKPRISHWLPSIFGAEDNDINRAFGRMFLISAVARALSAGCQVDTMLIIEGEQGIRKSTAVQELFGAPFVNGSVVKFTGSDVGLSMQGVWAVDLGELSAFGGTTIQTIKNFITLRHDYYRPPWGRHFIKRPRRIVFVGSTNEDNYLRDPTGARRFWPFHARKVDIDKLRANRDQLWAEAVTAFQSGEQWWIDKDSALEGLAKAVQSERYKEDVWAPKIDKILESHEVKLRICVTSSEILTALSITNDRQGEDTEARILAHLKLRGWHKKRCLRHGANLNWWFPEGYDPTQVPGRPRGE
jgi:predicted P-loop ATPase